MSFDHDPYRSAPATSAARSQARMVAAVANPAGASAEARLRGMAQVGLNADWNSAAYFLGPGTPNRTPGAAYLLDNEDGEWEIVRRWYADDNYAGLPEELYRTYADGNDAIVRVSPLFGTVAEAFAWLDARSMPNRNPALRRHNGSVVSWNGNIGAVEGESRVYAVRQGPEFRPTFYVVHDGRTKVYERRPSSRWVNASGKVTRTPFGFADEASAKHAAEIHHGHRETSLR